MSVRTDAERVVSLILPVLFFAALHGPWIGLHNTPPSASHHVAATPHQSNSLTEVHVAERGHSQESTFHSTPPLHHRYAQSSGQFCTVCPMPRYSFLYCTISVHLPEHAMRTHHCWTFHRCSLHSTTTILTNLTIVITVTISTTHIISASMLCFYDRL